MFLFSACPKRILHLGSPTVLALRQQMRLLRERNSLEVREGSESADLCNTKTAEPTGLDPATSAMAGQRSNQLS